MAKKIAVSAFLVFLAVLSAFIIWGSVLNPEAYAGMLKLIEGNIGTVLKLTGGSTVASAAVSMIPGDTATPIADKLADFSTYFVVVLCVLYMEKFLMVLTGMIAFRLCFPAACVMGIISQFSRTRFIKELAVKTVILGIVLAAIIPVSVTLSDSIYKTYQGAIDGTIQSASDISGSIRGTAEEENSDSGFLTDISGGVVEKFSLALDAAEKLINSYIESLAIMIVVSCLVPLVVFLLFFQLMKALFNIPAAIWVPPLRLPAPEMGRRGERQRIVEKEGKLSGGRPGEWRGRGLADERAGERAGEEAGRGTGAGTGAVSATGRGTGTGGTGSGGTGSGEGGRSGSETGAGAEGSGRGSGGEKDG